MLHKSQFISSLVWLIICMGFLVQPATSVTALVLFASQDAEEMNGGVKLDSPDLEIGRDQRGENIVCMRFDNVPLEKNQKVRSAQIYFTARDGGGNLELDPQLRCKGEKNANPSSFSTADRDLSSRPLTDVSAFWQETRNWVQNERYETTPLQFIVEEIISLSGWVKSNSMVICCRSDDNNPPQDISFRRASSIERGAAPILGLSFDPVSSSPTSSPTSSPIRRPTSSPTSSPLEAAASTPEPSSAPEPESESEPTPAQEDQKFNMPLILGSVGCIGLGSVLFVRVLRRRAAQRETLRNFNGAGSGGNSHKGGPPNEYLAKSQKFQANSGLFSALGGFSSRFRTTGASHWSDDTSSTIASEEYRVQPMYGHQLPAV